MKLKNAREKIIKTIDNTMIYTYYEIGRRIVEEEQNGEGRAKYGKQLLENLLSILTAEFGKVLFSLFKESNSSDSVCEIKKKYNVDF